jgi:hypothetical protein
MAAASLEFAAAPLEESICLATASPLGASSTTELLLLLWSPLIYRGCSLEVSSTIVWLLLHWSPLLYRGLLTGGVLHNCVAAAPLESAALQGLLTGCFLHNCVAAAPLESAALQGLLAGGFLHN